MVVSEYLSAVSFKETDTVTGVRSADNMTASNAQYVRVHTDPSGATVALGNGGSGGISLQNITIFSDTALTYDAGADYALGGSGINFHNFGETMNAIAAVHIIP